MKVLEGEFDEGDYVMVERDGEHLTFKKKEAAVSLPA
jgi:hypothetical protein